VKFPYPTLVRLMSGRSAIVEPGDGEITVPPVLQPVMEIFSPLPNVLLPPSLSNDTYLISSIQSSVGLGAGGLVNFNTMKAGRWDFDITNQYVFSGTNNIAVTSALNLVDPDGNVAPLITFVNTTYLGVRSIQQPLRFLFPRDGFFFQQTFGATIAGDVSYILTNAYARRIF